MKRLWFVFIAVFGLSSMANFAVGADPHTVTFVAGVNGSIVGDTEQTVNTGADCSPVTAVPNSSYYFYQWTGVDNSADNPLTVKKVTGDMTITATFVDRPVYHVARGSAFTINAAAPFAEPPRVAIRRGDSATVFSFKPGASTARCVWTGEEKPGVYELVAARKVLTDKFVVEQATLTAMVPNVGSSRDMITMTGKFFGSACPKVYMVYTDSKGKMKKVTCNVYGPSYPDVNGKPRQSYMDVDTGVSYLTFTVPKGITMTTSATVILSCGNSGSISVPFNQN